MNDEVPHPQKTIDRDHTTTNRQKQQNISICRSTIDRKLLVPHREIYTTDCKIYFYAGQNK
jgi:hypothetical protein